jgi:hypothetical protein
MTQALTGFATNLYIQKARAFALTGICTSSVLLAEGNRTRQVWFFYIIPGVRCHMETDIHRYPSNNSGTRPQPQTRP